MKKLLIIAVLIAVALVADKRLTDASVCAEVASLRLAS